MKTDVTFTLRWHFEAKNLALQNALRLRCPLSVEQSKALRLYYSEYLAHLVSATDLLLEKEYLHREAFKSLLEEQFVFEGHPDGNANYSFVRELRNSVVHRGYDITSAAHVEGDLLLVIAPPSITNRGGSKVYQGLGYYLLEVIAKCEGVIGSVIARHLSEVGLLSVAVEQDQAVDAAKEFIEASDAMPPWAKEMALGSIDQVDFAEVRRAQTDALVKILNTNGLQEVSAQQGDTADAKSRAAEH
ncbi:MAG: hypothetical protein JZU65_03215 [Chlorobium sp.]|jgi:hypothetical protein|nr:hypothetical protein [Chlorobium sp.]